MSHETNQINELKQVARFLKKYRLKLAAVTLVCAVLSAVISLFIPKEFESTAIVFPPGNLSLDVNSENPNFGYDIEADRLLQILQSTEIRDSVIKKFNLADYYGIDQSEKEWLSKLNLKYQKDVEFERTTFMSIVITVQTKDPELSAGIANHILMVADKVREKLYKQNVKLAFAKTSDEFRTEKHICDSLYANLQLQFKDMGISGLILLAPNAQLNFNLEQLSKGSKSDTSNLSIGANILAYRYHTDRRNTFEVNYKRIKKMLEYPIAQIHVLDKAEPNYRKAYPLVSINVLVSALLGFLFTSLYYIIKPKP